ncbi:MAG: alpha/beta hydrolase [Planctomycetaceae bacterium]
MSVLRRLLRISVVTYTMVVIVLGFVQRQLLYHPLKATNLAVAQFPDIMQSFPAATDVSIRCTDGVTIRGWLLRKTLAADDAPVPPRPLILFLHGNGGNRAGRVTWYQMIAEADADVLAIDYHGYGDSEGSISQETLERGCDASMKFITEDLGYHPGDVMVMGTSLGGAAAVYTAANQCRTGPSPGALLTVATFSSMVDVASSIYWWVPVRMVLLDRYPSDQQITAVDCPVVSLHGEDDALVHMKFGRRLFDATADKAADGTPKVWVSMPGVTHNNLTTDGRPFIQDQLNRLTHRWRQQQ